MSIVVMGVSHKTAPIEVREKVAITADERPAALSELLGFDDVREAVIVSTCNRVEAYVDATTDRAGIEALTEFFKRLVGRGGDDGAKAAFDEHDFFSERGMDAVEHAFRVVCSLDSQLLGEAQILGQMREAFEAASAQGACGEVLTKLFKSALHLGKRARSETAIGQDSVSLSTTAFKVARKAFPDLADRRVLMLGSGEMARLAAIYLQEAGVHDLVVCSRTRAHADALAREFGGSSVEFADRYDAMAGCDVVFSMTGAPGQVVDAAPLEAARRAAGAGTRRLVAIDEAVPRDIDPACGELPGVELFNLEALSAIVDQGMEQRLAAVGAVERLVEQACDEFFAWMQGRLVTPTIRDIHVKGDAIAEHEADRAAKELGKLLGRPATDEEVAVLQAMGSSIAKKILHGPTVRLRKEAGTPDSYYYTGAARYLFGLDSFPASPSAQQASAGDGGGKLRPFGHVCVGVENCPAGGCAVGRSRAKRESA